MEFHAGDAVMHWVHGLGTILRLEERDILGKAALYYAVQIGDLTIWVPADKFLGQRLRRPTPKTRFKRLVEQLATPGEALPADRHERKLMLVELLRDGKAESLVRVIRALCAYKKVHSLNDNDHTQLNRAERCLVAEWGQVLSVTPQEAESELRRLLESIVA
ncbi:MAG: CarD family transcriptional regulator [Anaerolineales bacterium]|jgi:RNA polymerase-interacting CarD/CdnL/TRCF family regulator